MKLLLLSDIHIWQYTWNPRRLIGRRSLRTIELLMGRAKRFELTRLEEVVERARSLEPDHVLITGDLTTMALPAEFLEARRLLAPLLHDPGRITVLPGNHDRTTRHSSLFRRFEMAFGDCMPEQTFPWLRWLDGETALLGLDPTRPYITPKGRLPDTQLKMARELIDDPTTRARRLIVACHYPLAAPPPYERELARKRLENDAQVLAWLAGVGPHLYCCGHLHAAWAFRPRAIPNQLCLNSGAPLERDRTGLRPPGFLEIDLHGSRVTVIHHAWDGANWSTVALRDEPDFFTERRPTAVLKQRTG